MMETSEKTENTGQVYESGCLFVPIIADKDVLAEVSKIKDTLENLACDFISGDGPQLKTLAYPMEKMMNGSKQLFKEAYFVWLKFRSTSDKIKDLKTFLDKNENLLRYLLLKTTEKDMLLSGQKKAVTAKEQRPKKIIKPVKIVKTDKSLEKEEEVSVKEKKIDTKTETKEDIDKTIDELVIK